MALPSRYRSGASQGHLEIGGPRAVTRPGTEGLPQLLFPPGGSKLPVPSQHAGEEETVADDTYHTHGVSLPRPHDQRALLSPQNTWHIEKHGMRSLCCLFLLHLHPRLRWALTRQRQNPSLCSPPPAVALPAMPEQSIQLCSSPPAPSSRGKAGQLGQEYPPTAGKPHCSPVPHKFVRPLGMEFMRGDSSKEKVPEITA